jgi:hypothetical protein
MPNLGGFAPDNLQLLDMGSRGLSIPEAVIGGFMLLATPPSVLT